MGMISSRERLSMVFDPKSLSVPATIVCDPEICGGAPTIRGTRIPVEMILAYLRDGCSREEMYSDYPRLPIDGIEAVITWTEHNLGPHWGEQPVAA